MAMDTDIIKYQVDKFAVNGMLFDRESGWNEYIDTLSAEEQKQHIVINIISGKDLFVGISFKGINEAKLICSVDSEIFKRIDLYYTPALKDDYQHISFSDDRVDIISADCYAPYMALFAGN